MGPTNVALVKLFQADQTLREVQGRLEATTKNVRVQDRRVRDLNEKIRSTSAHLKEQQAHAHNLDLDLKTRDAHIEKLRAQQQEAKNNKEYQAFLVEINTAKVDRNKVEEDALKVLTEVEKLQG
jgi:predicted  nucleic acid-binding Zn-ribbon protein